MLTITSWFGRGSRWVRPLLLIGLLVSNLTACRRGGVSPQDDDLTLKAQETERLNSRYLPVALSGDYRAVVINWEKDDVYNFKTEGSETYAPPYPASLQSHYTLWVEPTVGQDSIRLTFTGDGYGGRFEKLDLGRFRLTENLSRSNGPGYVLDSWNFGSRADASQIHANRLAYTDHTDLGFGLTLSRVIDKSRPDYGQVVVNITNQSRPSDRPRTMQPWAHISFTRRSPGVFNQ